ncbi:hypothetical protein [uncultured Friedmanniella sp.]|uniref:hypothetical protein n=1 Tax=uncultured Friedmanniella sp. TaxID=335381 RepID=UPI0035C97ADB
MAQTAAATAPTTAPSPLLRVLQVFAALAVLDVLFQFVTAGQLFPSGGPDGLHAAGAIALHVVSGIAAIAAVLLWRQGRTTIGVAALAVVVFGYGFVQAAIGGYDTLYIHVPGAMLLTAGVVWLLLAALRGRAR